ncbi:unnamed protein product [Amoebophrya sp. A25]|nr:unnamed protein product [Amoebophrya sp. A25]|eukprot:GSA25T00003401001.1
MTKNNRPGGVSPGMNRMLMPRGGGDGPGFTPPMRRNNQEGASSPSWRSEMHQNRRGDPEMTWRVELNKTIQENFFLTPLKEREFALFFAELTPLLDRMDACNVSTMWHVLAQHQQGNRGGNVVVPCFSTTLSTSSTFLQERHEGGDEEDNGHGVHDPQQKALTMSLKRRHHRELQALVRRTGQLMRSYRSREFANTAVGMRIIFAESLSSGESRGPNSSFGLRHDGDLAAEVYNVLRDKLMPCATTYFRDCPARKRWSVPEFSMLTYSLSRFRHALPCRELWTGLFRIVADELQSSEQYQYFGDHSARFNSFSPQSVMNLAQAYATVFCGIFMQQSINPDDGHNMAAPTRRDNAGLSTSCIRSSSSSTSSSCIAQSIDAAQQRALLFRKNARFFCLLAEEANGILGAQNARSQRHYVENSSTNATTRTRTCTSSTTSARRGAKNLRSDDFSVMELVNLLQAFGLIKDDLAAWLEATDCVVHHQSRDAINARQVEVFQSFYQKSLEACFYFLEAGSFKWRDISEAAWALKDLPRNLCDDDEGISLLFDMLVEEFRRRLQPTSKNNSSALEPLDAQTLVVFLHSLAERRAKQLAHAQVQQEHQDKNRFNVHLDKHVVVDDEDASSKEQAESVKSLLHAVANYIAPKVEGEARRVSQHQLLKSVKAQDLALLAWSYATIFEGCSFDHRVSPPVMRLFDEVERGFLAFYRSLDDAEKDERNILARFVPQNLTNLAWAFAAMNVNADDRFFPTIAEAFLCMVQRQDHQVEPTATTSRKNHSIVLLTLQNVANLIWAFAALNYVPRAGQAEDIPSEFFNAVWTAASDIIVLEESSTTRAGLTTASSRTSTVTTDPHPSTAASWSASIYGSFSRAANELTLQNVCNLCWAFAVFVAGKLSLLQSWSELRDRGHDHQVQELPRLTALEAKFCVILLDFLRDINCGSTSTNVVTFSKKDPVVHVVENNQIWLFWLSLRTLCSYGSELQSKKAVHLSRDGAIDDSQQYLLQSYLEEDDALKGFMQEAKRKFFQASRAGVTISKFQQDVTDCLHDALGAREQANLESSKIRLEQEHICEKTGYSIDIALFLEDKVLLDHSVPAARVDLSLQAERDEQDQDQHQEPALSTNAPSRADRSSFKKKIAIEVQGEQHYVNYGTHGRTTGRTFLKRVLLEQSGWVVKEISPLYWRHLTLSAQDWRNRGEKLLEKVLTHSTSESND